MPAPRARLKRRRGEFAKMFMVRKEQNLGLPGQTGQHRQCRGCAGIVELDKQVVDNQRNGFPLLQVFFDRGDA